MEYLLGLLVGWMVAGLLGVWMVLRCVHQRNDCLEVRDFIPACLFSFTFGPFMLVFAYLVCRENK